MTAYPRIGCYSGNRTFGTPFLKQDAAGKYTVIDDALVRAMARYQIVTMDIAPWASVSGALLPEVIVKLRRYNPSIRVGMYQLIMHHWLTAASNVSPSDLGWVADWWRNITNNGGWIVNPPPFCEVDTTKKPVVDGMIRLLGHVASLRMFDFAFFDCCAPTLDWASTSADFTAAKDEARLVQLRRLVTEVKKAGGPGFDVIVNGTGAERLPCEGLFLEGFDTSLLPHDQARARLADDPRPMNWLQSEWYADPTTAAAAQDRRFGLGTACMFDAIFSHGPGRDLTIQPPYQSWWAPEYAVDPKGLPDPTGKYVGWLGEPLGPAFGGTIIQRRQFAGGEVIVNAGSASMNITLPPGLRRIGGGEMGSITVPAKDAAFLQRMR